jgi:hypothetical protein
VFLSCEFEKTLNVKYRELAKKLGEQVEVISTLGAPVISAVLAHTTLLHPVFSDKKAVCNLFGADEKKFQILLDFYNETEEKL